MRSNMNYKPPNSDTEPTELQWKPTHWAQRAWNGGLFEGEHLVTEKVPQIFHL